MTREEAVAEAAWDPTEADPLQEQSFSFDNLYSLNDAVPDDVREELTRVGYGPPVRLPPACVVRAPVGTVLSSILNVFVL
jgi:transposase